MVSHRRMIAALVLGAGLGVLGIPVEGLGLIIGVDRFLDMCRTTVNVIGDLAAAVYVARGEPAGSSTLPSAARSAS